ncbi:hypothetical protein [Parabacteroides chinchillae]
MKVFSSFPYEGKSTDHVFPGTNYSNGAVNDYTFALYDAEEYLAHQTVIKKGIL